jgi:hypothetical protein
MNHKKGQKRRKEKRRLECMRIDDLRDFLLDFGGFSLISCFLLRNNGSMDNKNA